MLRGAGLEGCDRDETPCGGDEDGENGKDCLKDSYDEERICDVCGDHCIGVGRFECR
jgi:hypothetical protein